MAAAGSVAVMIPMDTIKTRLVTQVCVCHSNLCDVYVCACVILSVSIGFSVYIWDLIFLSDSLIYSSHIDLNN